MSRRLYVPTLVLGTVVVALAVAIAMVVVMMRAGVGESRTVAIDVATSTSAAASPTAHAPSPTASDAGSGASSDTGDEAMSVTIEGALLPDGVPTEVDAASFTGGTNAMSITVDGVVQRDDCAVILMHVTPTVDIAAFSLPTVGLVRSGLFYGTGTCDATGLIESGYVSNFTQDRPAGESFAFIAAVPNPGGTMTKPEAVAVAVADGKYVFFEPTETTLP